VEHLALFLVHGERWTENDVCRSTVISKTQPLLTFICGGFVVQHAAHSYYNKVKAFIANP